MLPFRGTSTIKDKSVETFEQNKRFLSASFRNFKNRLFVDSLTPSPPFQCWNTLRWHCHVVRILKGGGEGVEMWKLKIENLTCLTKQVFFGECLNCFVHDCSSFCLAMSVSAKIRTIAGANSPDMQIKRTCNWKVQSSISINRNRDNGFKRTQGVANSWYLLTLFLLLLNVYSGKWAWLQLASKYLK